MRTLKFLVNATTLKQDPTSNFDGLFPAPNQHIEAEFSFSKEWESAVKVAAFYSILGKEYPPQPINEEKLCIIPPEALNLPAFKLQVLGMAGGKPLSTNMLTVYQKGGKV